MKRIIACICIASMISFTTVYPVYAADKVKDDAKDNETVTAPYKLPDETDDKSADKSKDKDSDKTSDEEETAEQKPKEVMNLTAESAVKYGLEHNKSLEILDNKIKIAMITSQNASKNSRDLKDAKNALNDASNELYDKRKQLDEAQDGLDQAGKLLDAGRAPQSVPFKDAGGSPIVIPAGADIASELVKNGYPPEMAPGIASEIISQIRGGLSGSQGSIDEAGIAISEAQKTLDLKREQFKDVLKDTSEKLDVKMDYGSFVTLDANDASKLMITMAGVNLDVTRYAKEIYKNQIAMLISKNYYDALHTQKILELKKIARDRGEKQYNVVKLSYDNGMKSKDDMLLSKMYYDGTIVEYNLAEANYKNVVTVLKENMNLDMDTEITLADSMLNDVTEEKLEEGIKSGLTNRLEIQQTLGQLAIYQLNEKLLNSRAEYKSSARAAREAKLLREGAELQLDQVKTKVRSEVSQSYESMVAVGKMLEASKDLVSNAEEVVRIANLKYEQGFGVENSLLKQMNLEQSSGTMIELIAAQEKLAEVEAQVAQIRYNYTMAKIKYQNDAGILTYK
ncbi:MAG TPA: hypothetical protein DCM73_09300 [Clostridiales bacterium]|nr:hypothetical protein [Clostridiales bacterium]